MIPPAPQDKTKQEFGDPALGALSDIREKGKAGGSARLGRAAAAVSGGADSVRAAPLREKMRRVAGRKPDGSTDDLD